MRAWSVLTDPVDGTMLSVLEAAAAVPVPQGVEDGSNQQLKEFLAGVSTAARAAVLVTPDQLEILRETGTVDAGALGMLVVLDALARTVGGDDAGDENALDALIDAAAARAAGAEDPPHAVHGGVEVMCTVELSPLDAAELRHELSEVGTSVIMSAVTDWIGVMDPEGTFEREVEPWLLPLDRMVTVTVLDGDLLVSRSALLLE